MNFLDLKRRLPKCEDKSRVWIRHGAEDWLNEFFHDFTTLRRLPFLFFFFFLDWIDFFWFFFFFLGWGCFTTVGDFVYI